jgi:hypothetical protein
MATKKNNGQGESGAHASPPHLRLKPALSSRRPGGVDAAIGKKMRAMYDDLLHQPIPDRFVELLKQIDQVRENKS